MSHHIHIHLRHCYRPLLACLMLALILIGNAQAQSAAFTYQGRLTDAGNPATGMYDFQFRLFDSTDFVTGIQQGPTLTRFGVEVTNGVLSVQLDFGAGVFDGSARFLEIGLRPAGSQNPFTVLGPRQPVTSTPYAVRSATAVAAETAVNAANATNATNAAQLGGIAASQYVVTTDARLSDARPPVAGSPSYIQNGNTQQAGTNFNISGDGTAGGVLSGNVVNAATQYKIGGMRILVVNGPLSGGIPLTASNTFLGENAGLNTTPNPMPNVINGKFNSFFGANAGRSNTNLGTSNSFFGTRAGEANTDGVANSFFGSQAGKVVTTGQDNSFFGSFSGASNTTGESNSFFGQNVGFSNTTGRFNTLVGASADVGANNLSNATAIGYRARVDQSNSLVLGGINVDGAGAGTNVGIGTTSPEQRLHIVGNSGFIGNVGIGTTNPLRALQIGPGIDSLFTLAPSDGSPNAGAIQFGDNTGWRLHIGRQRAFSGGPLISGAAGAVVTILDIGRVGIGTTNPDQLLSVNGNASKVGGGSWATFSDERLKNIRGRFNAGLNEVMRLEPIRYEYKAANALGIKSEGEHVGFSAQAVERVIPEAVTRNLQGYLLVNNDPIMWAMLNAIKEQQEQIDLLKKVVCLDHPDATFCKPAK